jgi:hypothetical protein
MTPAQLDVQIPPTLLLGASRSATITLTSPDVPGQSVVIQVRALLRDVQLPMVRK